MKKKKIAQLESLLAQLKSGSSGVDLKSSNVYHDMVKSHVMASPPPPSRDEYNKACQTLETAFVPCEGCYLVQQSLREAGRTLVTTCQTLSITSHLARYQANVSNLDWLSGNCSHYSSSEYSDINNTVVQLLYYTTWKYQVHTLQEGHPYATHYLLYYYIYYSITIMHCS